jgi:hypothetical protein
MKRQKREPTPTEEAIDALDRLDALMKRVTDATATIDPKHLHGKDKPR